MCNFFRQLKSCVLSQIVKLFKIFDTVSLWLWYEQLVPHLTCTCGLQVWLVSLNDNMSVLLHDICFGEWYIWMIDIGIQWKWSDSSKTTHVGVLDADGSYIKWVMKKRNNDFNAVKYILQWWNPLMRVVGKCPFINPTQFLKVMITTITCVGLKCIALTGRWTFMF